MKINFNDSALEKLAQIPPNDSEKIRNNISQLPLLTNQANIKRVAGPDGDLHYFRSDGYRIAYTQNGDEINIFEVESRDRLKEDKNDLVVSYQTLRNLIGFAGMAMPPALVLATISLGHERRFEPSISDYYYTNTGDILVVVLCVLGTFLITYNGYNFKEKCWMVVAAICGMGVAFSPTHLAGELRAKSIHTANKEVPHFLGLERHFWFAGIFFFALAIISLIYFPMTDEKNPSLTIKNKRKRNVIFKCCGWAMISGIVCIGIYIALLHHLGAATVRSVIGETPVVFIFETIAVEAFGISWLTKGETFFPDGEHYIVKAYRAVSHYVQAANPGSH